MNPPNDSSHPTTSPDRETWQRTTLAASLERMPTRQEAFTTLSGLPVKELYTPADVAHLDPIKDIGFPGEYPYTRGVHPTMYRARPWTIRQVAGFG
ncbi:MAG: methylmalonyl-CoA mutase family protein, partial [Gemmatimonadales bacterium]|nr:methylmalonyl-CoA mutase family protein [Gemmatimonadales bacterium]